MSEREWLTVHVAVTIALLFIVLVGSLTITGHRWPPAPREYPTKVPSIMRSMP